MRVDLSRWVLHSYNPESECIVVPGRGEIPVTAEACTTHWAYVTRGRKCFMDGMQKLYHS